MDAVLKVGTPYGPCWRRYNQDGYGQRADGGPYRGWGRGRAWPLLTGERGHYELAAGRDATVFIRAIEGFASPTGLLPEQVWDEPDRQEVHMVLGRPTGAAMPLMWAHAEYVKLLRSVYDGQVFDVIPEVANRYRPRRRACQPLEIWKQPNRHVSTVKSGWTLRIQAPAPFRLVWSNDGWQTSMEIPSLPTALGIGFVDIQNLAAQRDPVRFTFFWTNRGRWEGRNYEVAVGA